MNFIYTSYNAGMNFCLGDLESFRLRSTQKVLPIIAQEKQRVNLAQLKKKPISSLPQLPDANLDESDGYNKPQSDMVDNNTKHLREILLSNLGDENSKEQLNDNLSDDIKRQLYTCCRTGNSMELSKIVNDDDTRKVNYLSTHTTGPDNDTYLHHAAADSQLDVVRLLLDLGCDPTIRNRLGQVAYQVCVSVGFYTVLLVYHSRIVSSTCFSVVPSAKFEKNSAPFANEILTNGIIRRRRYRF